MPGRNMAGRGAFGPLTGIGDEAAPGADGQLAALRRLGWTTVELRDIDGTALADLSPAAFGSLTRRLADAGVTVTAVASRIGNWSRPVTGDFGRDLAELDVLAERCAALGCRLVRIMSYPNDGLPEADWADRVLARTAVLADRAERAGLVLVHENCAGWAGDRADRALRLLRAVDSPALRLLFDIGNGVPYGYDAPEMLRELAPHVAHVHVKDAVRLPDGSTAYTLPGEGEAGVARCLRILADHGYTGALSLEPHLAVRPHEGLARAGADAADLFVRAGRALAALLDHAAPGGPA
ncbi:sugar phosphate isomerase/epimerase [Streptomyces sp. NEAU-sy36]|uniref:sugar phosphate isomerase/epimerase family protein n=1 Tax=unclassified Streptomyces TaxID=2593676 RepID=UPI0015D587FE|nr:MULTISPECIES: sugar phosphate isomerase/epimerase family protein [unclassified Streptomyces]QLJ02486.1 sugar phosphate isomerase/epimerase [Streptomyces sp. NEAU-sy36]